MIGGSQRTGPPLIPNRTVALLEQIVERLDRLEQRVEALGQLVDQGPALVGAVTDTVDEFARTAQARGIDLDARVRSSLQLFERVTEPATAEALGRVVDRVEALEPMLAHLETLPGMAAMVTDFFDEIVRDAQRAGIDVEARLTGLRGLMLEMTAPETVAGLRALLPLLPQLAPLAKHGESMPGLVAMGVDAFDDWLSEQMARGFDPDQMLSNMLTGATRFTALLDSAEFVALMESGVLSPRALDVVGRAARALATPPTRSEEPRVGLFGLMRAMRDPDMQRALGFALHFARGFGRQIEGGAPRQLTGPAGE